MTITETYFAITRRVAAPRERVFAAWTAERIEFCEVDAPRRLAFALEHGGLAIVTLSDERGHTVVTFEGSAPADRADEAERVWAARLAAVIGAAQGSQAGGNAGGIRPG